MLCSDCQKRPACVHVTQIINNKKIEKNLCEECVKNFSEVKFSLDMPLQVNEFIKGMLSYSDRAAPPEREAVCPECGMTFGDFNHNGKLGCSNCYKVFKKQLEPVIKRIHGTSRHNGKLPKRCGGRLQLKVQIKELRLKLEECIASEDYEQAVVVRDKIKLLEKEMDSK